MFAHLPRLIVALRHPQCLHNVDYDGAIQQGIENKYSPITKLGEAQGEITAAYIRQMFGQFDAVFSSNYTRTHAIPQYVGCEHDSYDYLNERNQGLMHTMGPETFFATFPEEKVKIDESYYHYRAPEGETCPDVEMRLRRFLSPRERFWEMDSVLISGHGITGRCLRKVLTNASEADWHAWGGLANASVTVYEKTQAGFECAVYNHVPWNGLLSGGRGTEA